MPKIFLKREFAPGLPGNRGGIGPVQILTSGSNPYAFPFGIGEKDPKVFGANEGWSHYVDVIWRHLRTEREARHANEVYATLQALRKIKPTTKTVGRIEPRPYASEALRRCQNKLLEVWRSAVK